MGIRAAALLWICFPAALAGEPAAPAFTRKPTATKAGDAVKIDFAVSAPTDVEVAMLDARGKVVRHLAAGLLGKSPPAPLRAGLSQSLEWDGKDDRGRLVLSERSESKGPFRVRVGLGLRPELEAYLFDRPGAIGGADSLAVDGEGRLYVSCSAGGIYAWNAPGMLTRVYDREGKYLQTIVPFPANLPLEKMKGAGVFQADGRLFPVFHDIQVMRMYPGREHYGHEMFVTADGRLCRLVTGNAGYCLRFLGTDGSAPDAAAMLGGPLAPGMRPGTGNRAWIGSSSDSKHVYFSGVGARTGDKHMRLHAVWRAPLDGSGPGAVFLGKPDESGADEKHFKDPMGVAADGKGFLYVADSGNNRIQVFKEADGSLAGSVPCPAPATVQVHPGTGAIYVLSGPGLNLAVVKLSGRENPRELARLPIGRAIDGRLAAMVLDGSAEPPVLWISGNRVPFRRIEDKGAKLEAGDLPAGGGPSCGNAEDLIVDRERDELYFKSGTETFWRMDIKSGKVEKLPYPGGSSDAAGTQLAFTADGETFYTWHHISSKGQPGLRKWNRAFKPVDFEALGTNNLNLTNPMNFACRGLSVSRNGDIWLIPPGPKEAYTVCTEMQVYKPDGTRKSTFLWRCSEGATGPRFDREGNVYVVECIKEHGKALPDWFADKIPPLVPGKTSRPRKAVSAPTGSAAWMYGTILKFPPSGGAIWYNNHKIFGGKSGWNQEVPAEILNLPRAKFTQLWHEDQKLLDVEVQGALWSYYGAAPFADKWGNNDCNCQSARFDVDDYGRVFFPDAGRFRLGVLDTGGNEIGFVGAYGNRDCGGKGSRNPDPEIAFAYPYTVAVSRTHVFVGDLLNGRIAKLKLAHAAEETAAVQ